MNRAVVLTVLGLASPAAAGGLFLPGSGAISTSRAGAAVASTEGGEALGLNPAGISKSEGTTITVSAAIIDYAMSFQRRGTYDDIPDIDLPYEGTPYPLVRDDAKPPLALGGYQPIPVIAITSDLGKVVPGLTVAAGLYAPNSYPFRRMCTEQPGGGCRPYTFNGDPNEAPSPARYDIVEQDALLLMPTIAASYRITDKLDVGARFGVGRAHIDSKIHVWGKPGNLVEDVGGDGLFHIEGEDNFVPGFGVGAAFRPTANIELAAVYNSKLTLGAKGWAHAELGPRTGATGIDVMVAPLPDEAARCGTGGTAERQRGCVTIEIPQTAAIGGRYKFLDGAGKLRGDVELQVGWENWGAERASDFLVVIDSEIVTSLGGGVGLKDNIVAHGFRDVWNARLGGSWLFPVGESAVIARGGVGYDTAAAKPGWMRADLDGAARTTLTVGAGYRGQRFQIDAGFGVSLEGTTTNPGTCNPISDQMRGCAGDGVEDPIEDREGPDPINPIVNPDQQAQGPVNQGVFKSHYVMFMLGASTWF